MVDQPDFIYFECKECGFDSVQKADFTGSDTCPLCDSDNHYSRMNQRICRDTDRPEGKDGRKTSKPSCKHVWHLVGAQVIEIYRCSECGEESFT